MTPDDGRPAPALKGADLYETDFYAWTKAQAEALRHGAASDLDIPNLAEEVESLGRSERRACESFIRLILEHLLKVEFVDRPEDVRHHQAEITVFRLDLEEEMSPSLAKELPSSLDAVYQSALRRTQARFKRDGILVNLPQDCPYNWADVLGRDGGWFPEPKRK